MKKTTKKGVKGTAKAARTRKLAEKLADVMAKTREKAEQKVETRGDRVKAVLDRLQDARNEIGTVLAESERTLDDMVPKIGGKYWFVDDRGASPVIRTIEQLGNGDCQWVLIQGRPHVRVYVNGVVSDVRVDQMVSSYRVALVVWCYAMYARAKRMQKSVADVVACNRLTHAELSMFDEEVGS